MPNTNPVELAGKLGYSAADFARAVELNAAQLTYADKYGDKNVNYVAGYLASTVFTAVSDTPADTMPKHVRGALLSALAMVAAYDASKASVPRLPGDAVVEVFPPRPCPRSWGEPGNGELDCDRPRGHSGPHHVEQEWTSILDGTVHDD